MRPSESTREDMNDDIDCYEILLDQIASVSDRGNVLIVGDIMDERQCKMKVIYQTILYY